MILLVFDINNMQLLRETECLNTRIPLPTLLCAGIQREAESETIWCVKIIFLQKKTYTHNKLLTIYSYLILQQKTDFHLEFKQKKTYHIYLECTDKILKMEKP